MHIFASILCNVVIQQGYKRLYKRYFFKLNAYAFLWTANVCLPLSNILCKSLLLLEIQNAGAYSTNLPVLIMCLVSFGYQFKESIIHIPGAL